MTHTTASAPALRTISLSISSALWIGFLLLLATVGPRAALAPPPEPPPIDGIVLVTQPPPPPLPTSSQPLRETEGPAFVPSPLPAPPDVLEAAAATLAPMADATQVITRPVWLQRPGAADLARFYPERAIRLGRTGLVSLDCIVRTDGALSCSIAEETPAGWGFGDAALRISTAYRMQPATRDGHAIEARYTLRVPFEVR